MDSFFETPPKRIARRDALKLPFCYWFAVKRALGSPERQERAQLLSLARRSMSLNGTWSLTYGRCPQCVNGVSPASPPASWPTIPATVPGNVELDLAAAGRIEPPERGNRIYQLLKLESHQWWYRRTFRSETPAPGERAELIFEGLDCIGTVWLNGTLVGHAENMLIPHRFDVTSALLPGQTNELVVRIDPAVPAGRAASHAAGEWAEMGRWESLTVRKAPHMYGWDILPRAVSAGLWRDVRLEWISPVHFREVYWATLTADARQRRATLAVDWEFVADDAGEDSYRLEIVLRRNGRVALRTETTVLPTHGQQSLSLENADFWWPRGYGEPALYEAVLTLLNRHGDLLDRHSTLVGIRTIELRRTDMATPEKPGEFAFVVNGAPVFVKGTNWVPLDALHSRDAGHLDRVFPMLTELNCNMVRCWGGGVYESDRFFDLCDHTGIMVWQDFALACALYPQDSAFLNVISAEAGAVVRRLRNHASLALWSGNNECDDAYGWGAGLGHVDPNHDRISREALPAVVERLDPHRDYMPSSPYHSPALFAAGNDPGSMPEVHLWGPRGYFKAPFYTDVRAHFVSEIGYHGCPARSSLERMLDPEFVRPWAKDHEWNDQWLTKSVRFHPELTYTEGRNDLMIKQIAAFFGSVPDDLDEFILASQICQAEALKFFIEFWRQQKGPKRGILWWNLRDGWPIVSDAVVDYYNTRKLAFYYIQRVQRDVQVICCEAAQGQHPVVVVNDTLRPVHGRLSIVRGGDAAKLLDARFDVEPNGKAEVGHLRQPERTEMWLIEWSLEGSNRYGSHYLAARSTVHLDEYKAWMKLPGMRVAQEGGASENA